MINRDVRFSRGETDMCQAWANSRLKGITDPQERKTLRPQAILTTKCEYAFSRFFPTSNRINPFTVRHEEGHQDFILNDIRINVKGFDHKGDGFLMELHDDDLMRIEVQAFAAICFYDRFWFRFMGFFMIREVDEQFRMPSGNIFVPGDRLYEFSKLAEVFPASPASQVRDLVLPQELDETKDYLEKVINRCETVAELELFGKMLASDMKAYDTFRECREYAKKLYMERMEVLA